MGRIIGRLIDGKYVLHACPFCHSDEWLELRNTHTPSFWIACDQDHGGCGAEHHGGEYFASAVAKRKNAKRVSYDPTAERGDIFSARTLAQMPVQYQRAALSAIDKWNNRPAVFYAMPPTNYLKEFNA